MFSIIKCCDFSAYRWGVPVGGMTVSALETLFQTGVHDGLSGTVIHRQVSASHVPSLSSVLSISVAGSSVEVALSGGGRGCQSQSPRGPRVAKGGRLGEKPAGSC